MKSPRTSQVARSVIVAVMIAAWFVAFDHCALASVFSPVHSSSAEQHCPGHSPDKKPTEGELPCCKLLVAAAAPAKVSAAYNTNLFAVQPYLTAECATVCSHLAAPGVELDTGPPGLRTFAESVLQRSLRAHAPPSLS